VRVIAIDPGSEKSGIVVFDTSTARVLQCHTQDNPLVAAALECWGAAPSDVLAIEMVASYGMAVGRDVFETVRWVGRFQQAWHAPGYVRLVYRQDVKMHLCQSMRAKDANIRQALIDRLGAPGTKKNPGPTYGVKGHGWSALAVAVTAADQLKATARV
jgi:hypothetical protein